MNTQITETVGNVDMARIKLVKKTNIITDKRNTVSTGKDIAIVLHWCSFFEHETPVSIKHKLL